MNVIVVGSCWPTVSVCAIVGMLIKTVRGGVARGMIESIYAIAVVAVSYGMTVGAYVVIAGVSTENVNCVYGYRLQ